MGESGESGLRERKKRLLRQHIRSTAIDLFVAKGYRETTMEQIAASADVAPRTVYRYFPTKDLLVIGDDDDELMLERFRAALDHQPPVDALRTAMRDLLIAENDDELDRHRTELVAAEPELQAAMLGFVVDLARRYAQVLAEHGDSPMDPDSALALAGAAAGIGLLAMDWTSPAPNGEKLRRIDAALQALTSVQTSAVQTSGVATSSATTTSVPTNSGHSAS